MRVSTQKDVVKFLDDWGKLTDKQKHNFIIKALDHNNEDGFTAAQTLNILVRTPAHLCVVLNDMLDAEAGV